VGLNFEAFGAITRGQGTPSRRLKTYIQKKRVLARVEWKDRRGKVIGKGGKRIRHRNKAVVESPGKASGPRSACHRFDTKNPLLESTTARSPATPYPEAMGDSNDDCIEIVANGGELYESRVSMGG